MSQTAAVAEADAVLITEPAGTVIEASALLKPGIVSTAPNGARGTV